MTYLIRLLFIFLSSLLLALPAFADATGQTEHAKLELLIESVSDESNARWAAIEFELEEGWHIYWKNPGDSGLEAQIQWDLPENLSAGPIHWLPPTRIEYSGLFNYGYEGTTALLIPLEGSLPNQGMIKAEVEFLICKDICIPQEASLSADLSEARDHNERIAAWAEKLPAPYEGRAEYDITEDGVFFAIDLNTTEIEQARIYHAWFYPLDDQTISNASEQEYRLDEGVVIINAQREGTSEPNPFRGVLEIATTDGQRTHYFVKADYASAGASATAEAAKTPAERIDMTLWLALISAFLGGIILNIMPCVLPVLSLKALSITKKSGASAAALRREGIAYTAGIVLSFVAVAGALIALQQAGAQIGWGFQLQSVGFVSALIYLLFVIGLNLSGAFEIPSRMTGLGSGLAERSGPAGSFFTGVLATIVATPCTAPFMATAIGFALGQSAVVALLIFIALGLGLAFPFLLITFIPAAARILPKPGAWMERFKQFLAFPIYATVIWLLWVLTQQTGSMGLLHALVGMLIIGFALWLLPLCRAAWLQIAVLIIAIAGLLWITDTNAPMPAAESERFSQLLLDKHLSSGKPVFVNATADWCITCKVNERVALRDEQVLAAIEEKGITYLTADWTNRNGEIANYLASFNRSGVPLYVYYAPGEPPRILPQLLTPSLVLDAFGANEGENK